MFWLLIRCCGCDGPARPARRMNTAYHNDALNWIIQCDRCFKETQEMWEDAWQEYRRGLL